MSDNDLEILELTQKLDNTNAVLGTLIVFLQRELGTEAATDLLRQLNGEEFKP